MATPQILIAVTVKKSTLNSTIAVLHQLQGYFDASKITLYFM